jgi:hypothetical protein
VTDPLEQLRRDIAQIARDIADIRERQGRNEGALAGLIDAFGTLRGAFESFAAEVRTGQANQDTRINQIATAQARHSGVIAVGAALVGALSGFFSRLAGGH